MDDDIAYAIQELDILIAKATANEQATAGPAQYEWFAARHMAENARHALINRKAA